MNDSIIEWNCASQEAQAARQEWLKNKKQMFPLEEEAEAVLQALLDSSILDPAVPVDADVLQHAKGRVFTKVPMQQGSLLKDALTVLESCQNEK